MNGDWPDCKGFWTGKRVMVTGGAGFLGSFVFAYATAVAIARKTIPNIFAMVPWP